MMLEVSKQTDQNKTGRRRIALYPGAFRPPHAAHLVAVLDLASRSDIDEVIVIISNRCRIIPGTTKALNADVVCQIWEVYLKDLKNIRIEVAKHTAIQHSLDYFNHANAGDTLLFCIGASDLSRGDDRFTKLSDLSRKTGVSAELISAPTGNMAVRSTDLRTMLESGASGRSSFMAALPAQLNKEQRERVWLISSDGMREISELVQEKVRAIIKQSDLGEISKLEPVKNGEMDPVFRVLFKDGRCHFIKYAGDTVESGCFGHKLKPKPRRRLSSERRTLKQLRKHGLDAEVELQKVVFFDKKTLTLVLTEICPEGKSLLDNFEKGHFDPAVAGAASCFLAGCHTLSSPINPAWGDNRTDLAHWEKMLNLKTVGMKSSVFSAQVRQYLGALKDLSGEAGKKRVQHQLLILDYGPENILLGENRIGVINFECCSTIGDPAYDFGLFLGKTIFWGLLTASESACRNAIKTSLNAYRERFGNDWFSIRARVVAFAGTAIFGLLVEEKDIVSQALKRALVQTATTLLSRGLCHDGEIDETMIRAASGKLEMRSHKQV